MLAETAMSRRSVLLCASLALLATSSGTAASLQPLQCRVCQSRSLT